MTGAIDLSTLADKTADDGPKLSDLTEEQREALAALAEGTSSGLEDATEVTTAFFVVVQDGEVYVDSNLDEKFVRERIPTPDDIYGAVSVIAKDLQTQESGQMAAMAFQQLMQAQVQAMQNQQLASHLNLPR